MATPDFHYHFVNWTGSGVDAGKVANPNSASTTITMERDYSVHANFAIDIHSLTTSSTSGGDVTTPGEGTYTYDYGQVVNIVATPQAGYEFSQWSGSGVDNNKVQNRYSAITKITMDGNYTVQANFVLAGPSKFKLQPDVARSARPCPQGYNVPLILKLYGPSLYLDYNNILTATPLFTYTTPNEITLNIDCSSRSVYFSVPNLEAGLYNVALSSPHTLINLKNRFLITGDKKVSDMGMLLEGNANDDVQIAGADFSLLLDDYLATPTNPRWNGGRCDFDRSGQVTSLDFSLLSANYNKTSPQTVQVGGIGGLGGLLTYSTVNLSLTTTATSIHVNDQFTVRIRVAAGTQQLVSIDSFVNFNPTYLEVVSVTPLLGKLPQVFCNQFDNVVGSIDLCQGSTDAPASGSFTMGTIVFKAKAATSGTDILFNLETPRKTDVAYQGESLVGSTTGLQVQIQP